jgi:GTP-binding protein
MTNPINKTVVIFGRTNAGKSTLFNTLTEKKQALTSNIEGTTRDSNISEVSWRGLDFRLVDTGGIINTRELLKKGVKHNEDIELEVLDQAKEYLKKADLIIFLVDAKDGLVASDREMAIALKKLFPNQDHIILAANKVESARERSRVSEFFQLNLGEPQAISASTGSGTGDLLDIIYEKLGGVKKSASRKFEEKEEKSIEPKEISICLIGKTNVGKSSLLNKILGYKRVIVSSVPHTTREPQDSTISYKERNIKIVDTAGISKKFKTMKGSGLEKEGIFKSLRSLDNADIALFMFDINEDLTMQDSKIVEEIINRRKSIIFIANKWDLIEEKDVKKFSNKIHGAMPFCTWAPILFVSAKTGDKVNKVLSLVLEIDKARNIELDKDQLGDFLHFAIKKHKPIRGKGYKRPFIAKIYQTDIAPPRFEIKIGPRDELSYTYLKFLENQLREKFKLTGTPVAVKVRKR